MQDTFAQLPYVIAAYGLGVSATLALVGASWRAMRRAESRRDEVKKL